MSGHNNAKVRPCTCKHDFQDKQNGPGNRVMNRMKQLAAGKEVAGSNKWRCTVCSKES